MIYWPGTKIPKSQGNAFTSWKTKGNSVFTEKNSVAKQIKTNGMAVDENALKIKKSFTIYAKAKP